MATVLIADDNRAVRAALRNLISREPDLEVVGEAENGNAALALAMELRPDVVLADISMPGPSGIEIAAVLRFHLPTTRVLIVSLYEDSSLVLEATRAGAAGYVAKRTMDTRLVPAIRGLFGLISTAALSH